jgi:hypothetical protein
MPKRDKAGVRIKHRLRRQMYSSGFGLHETLSNPKKNVYHAVSPKRIKKGLVLLGEGKRPYHTRRFVNASAFRLFAIFF